MAKKEKEKGTNSYLQNNTYKTKDRATRIPHKKNRNNMLYIYINAVFLSFDYTCSVLGDPIIRWGKFGIPLTGLTPPHACACPKSRHGFPTL